MASVERWWDVRLDIGQGHDRYMSTVAGKCRCGLMTCALTAKYPDSLTHGVYECPRCYEARKTLEALDIQVNG